MPLLITEGTFFFDFEDEFFIHSFVNARIQIIFLSSVSVDLHWCYSESMLAESTLIICAFLLMTISYSSCSILVMICRENPNKACGYQDHLFIIEERIRVFKRSNRSCFLLLSFLI